jgi:hypothetical protein
MRKITCIQLDITTVCDRKCPDCCCAINMNKRAAIHHPWEYFEALAPFIYGIDRIDLFGGEPTSHPKFREFVPRFKDLFGNRILTMTTNGFKTIEYAGLLAHFDFIQATPYDDKNAPAMEHLKKTHHDVRFFPGTFLPRNQAGGGKPCPRAFSEVVSYADSKFWPCCPGAGIDHATGFGPCVDWREKIQNWPMPCSTCFMSLPENKWVQIGA